MSPSDTLLIVDDEPSILEAYRYYLSPGERAIVQSSRQRPTPKSIVRPLYRLLLAETGEQAFALVREEHAQGRRVAAGFFDMKMPGGMDGLETIRSVRGLDPDILCCVVTAYEEWPIEDINRVFDRGHEDEWDYLQKPFTESEVRQKARNMVSSWARRRAQAQHRCDLEWLLETVTDLNGLPVDIEPAELFALLDRIAEFADAPAWFQLSVGDAIEVIPAGLSSGEADMAAQVAAITELAAMARRVAERGRAETGDLFSAMPLGAGRPARVAVLRHATPPSDDKRKLLRVLADNLNAALNVRRLYHELRHAHAGGG